MEEEAKKNGLTFNPEYLEMREREEWKVRIVEPVEEEAKTWHWGSSSWKRSKDKKKEIIVK